MSETKRVIIFADPKGSKFIELLSEYKGLENEEINFSKKNLETLAR